MYFLKAKFIKTVLSYKVVFGRELLNKYIMFSNSKIIVCIIVISILTKINHDYFGQGEKPADALLAGLTR